jgi:hypothetical protein
MCSEPVREFTPRPVTASTFVGMPTETVRTSRWRATDLTFGPLGRLVVTAVVFGVLVVGFTNTGLTPFGLWFFMGWFIAASMVLKQTWQKVRIDPDEPPGRGARLAARLPGRAGLSVRFPGLARPIPGAFVGLALAIVGVTVAVVAYWKLDQFGRFGILVLGVMTACSVLLIWLAGV